MSETKLKLHRKSFQIWTNEWYLVPTIYMRWKFPEYGTIKTFAIYFHFLCFHARLMFKEDGQ